jgi:hypothetical protein
MPARHMSADRNNVLNVGNLHVSQGGRTARALKRWELGVSFPPGMRATRWSIRGDTIAWSDTVRGPWEEEMTRATREAWTFRAAAKAAAGNAMERSCRFPSRRSHGHFPYRFVCRARWRTAQPASASCFSGTPRTGAGPHFESVHRAFHPGLGSTCTLMPRRATPGREAMRVECARRRFIRPASVRSRLDITECRRRQE